MIERIASPDPDAPDDLSGLLGPRKDDVAREIVDVVRFLLDRFSARHPVARNQKDDLAQDVLRICLEQARKICRGEAAPLEKRDAWICRVTHNAVLATYRRRASAGDEPLDEHVDPPAPATIPPEERLGLRRALAALDQACRDLLVRREVLGENRSDMADALGLSENVLGVRLHRCRKRLLALYLGEAA